MKIILTKEEVSKIVLAQLKARLTLPEGREYEVKISEYSSYEYCTIEDVAATNPVEETN